MNRVLEDKHWQNGSFTVGFSFSNGVAHCEGFTMETVVSHALGLKYRIQVKHPIKGNFWVMKGMEKPMSQDEIRKVIDEVHKGHLSGKEFIFEVFDKTGEKNLFGTRFNAEEKIPAEGYGNEHLVFTSFTWSYPLPADLQPIAKAALEQHMQGRRHSSTSP
jgi:hypothetical protein